MAYDDELAKRVRTALGARADLVEKAMFGGLAWMLHGNMACGVMADGLLVRVDPDAAPEVLREPHVREFGFEGRRAMRGFVLVGVDGLADDHALARWVGVGTERALALPPK